MAPDIARRTALAYAWHDAMLDQVAKQLKLGLSAYVEEADVTGGTVRLGEFSYGGQAYDTVELTVRVKTRETVSGMAA